MLAAALSAAAAKAALAQSQTAGSGAAAQQGSPAVPAVRSTALFPPQPPAPKRGFLNNLNWTNLWRQPLAALGSDDAKKAATVTREAVKRAAAATKDAAVAIVRLPGMRVIEAQERCAKAANGAPDCRTAAANACRAKGFAGGAPLDIRSSEACPTAVLLSGQAPSKSDCSEETVVLRALCQK